MAHHLTELAEIVARAEQARDDAQRAYNDALTAILPETTFTGKVTDVKIVEEPVVAVVGKIIDGEWTTRGLYNFCEYCGKYMHDTGWDCPHCGKGIL